MSGNPGPAEFIGPHAFPVMALNIIRQVLDNAHDPVEASRYLVRQVRELTGARTALLFQCPAPAGAAGHRLVAFAPECRREMAESDALARLAALTHGLNESVLWRPGEDGSEAESILVQLDCGPTAATPLAVRSARLGCLLLPGLPPDEQGIQQILDMLNTLSRVVSLIFRNAVLYEEQETIIEERTRSLRESEARLRLIADTVEDVFWITDWAEKRTVFVSRAYERVWGRTAESLYGSPMAWSDAIHADDRRRAQAAFVRMDEGDTYDDEYRVARPDGEIRWIHDRGFPVRDENGRIHRAVGIARDVTERKRVEEALRQEKDFAESLIETAQAIVLVLDTEGRIIRFNPYMEEISGYKLEEVQGRDWFDTFLPERDRARIREVFRTTVGDIETRGNVNPIVTRDGRELAIEWYNKTLKDAEGKVSGVLAVGQDITERKRLEEQLRQSEKMRAIGRLAGGIAHDFNNQLTGIMGYADLLVADLEDGTLKGYAEAIVRAAQRSADLTEQLLAFARKGKNLSAPTDMHMVISEVVRMLEATISKQIVIQQRLKANPFVIIGDPTQLQTALLNIALNARDAMPDGGQIIFETNVVVLDEDYCEKQPYKIVPGRYIQICITDSGAGMDEEMLTHIFEPFFTTKEQGHGTGMGLAAVYGTIKNHHGAINVYSEPGHGTTFKMYLPLAQSAADKADAAQAPIQGVSRVLVVDDEAVVRDLAVRMLSHLGYEVAVCRDGPEAVEYYRESWQQIDLVILDMIMPGMAGRDVFIAMREINPDIKALLSSGYGINGEVQHILDEGAFGFLQKPFQLGQLSRKVAEVVGQ